MDRKNITIADIARELGVSKTTVSRVISGKGRIGDETRERILHYIEKYDYKPNAIAQGLAKSRTYNLGVVMPEEYCTADTPFFINCMAGLHETAALLGYDLVLTICDNEDISNLERMVTNRKVDGIVLMRTFLRDKAVEYLKGCSVPFVVVGSSSYEGVVQVEQDNEGACRELISLLLSRGMRRIALIGGNGKYVVTKKRLDGYKAAFEERRLPLAPELIYMDRETPDAIKTAIDDILGKDVDCIACMDDNICTGVLGGLRRAGVSVPGQMKVASFFNSSILENHMPAVTSLSFDVRELGRHAGRTLINIIEKEEYQSMTLQGYEVVLRESTK